MEEIYVSPNKWLDRLLFTENRTQKHSKVKVNEITLSILNSGQTKNCKEIVSFKFLEINSTMQTFCQRDLI